jgi:hypothetical protein
MKSKNEEVFTYMRVTKDALYKIRELNAKDRQREKKPVKIYETVTNVVETALKASQQ